MTLGRIGYQDNLYASDIFFIDSLRGWATQGEKVIYTTDGGKLWNAVDVFPTDYHWLVPAGEFGSAGHRYHPMNLTHFTAVHFTDSFNGWVSGYIYGGTTSYHPREWAYGTIHKTSDGGRTWKPALGVGVGRPPFNDIFFIDAEKGWAVGKNMIYHTKDQGKSWIAQSLPSYDDEPRKIRFTKAAGWMVGKQYSWAD